MCVYIDGSRNLVKGRLWEFFIVVANREVEVQLMFIWLNEIVEVTLTEMLLVCCTHICYLPARIKYTCCICTAHRTHSCASYRIFETAPHVCHTQADEVCTHLSEVCTMCTMVMCSIHAVAHVLEAYMLHVNNCTHSACMHSAHLMCLYVAYMWRISVFVCAAHMKRCLNVQHVCCICA